MKCPPWDIQSLDLCNPSMAVVRAYSLISLHCDAVSSPLHLGYFNNINTVPEYHCKKYCLHGVVCPLAV